MLLIIDRYLLRQFLQVFAICFVSLTGLYVVFDAFTNLDEFLRYADQNGRLMQVMAEFYAYRSVLFFDRMGAMLAMVAGMFTLTWFQRHNELVALMAAGISRRRVIVPVIVASIVISLASAASRELVIPSLREDLSRDARELVGDTAVEFHPRYDHTTDIRFNGRALYTRERRISQPNFLLPVGLDQHGKQLSAEDAFYQPADASIGRPSGYLFRGVTQPKELLAASSLSLGERRVLITPADAPAWLKPGECFVASDVSFEQLAGGKRWRQLSSTVELIGGLHNPSLEPGADVSVLVHSRLVQPLLDMTLVFLGLPLVLRRENRNMFLAIGLCMGLVISFIGVVELCKIIGEIYLVPASLAAWLPLMIFGPMAVAMYDTIDP